MCCRRKRRQRISLLVPFQSKDSWRRDIWKWLRRYWKDALPGVEIVVGTDPKSKRHWWRPNPPPFSKTNAVNRAFRKSHGDIVVILDADVFLDADDLIHCANRIRLAESVGVHLWFMPYMHHYRLTKGASALLLDSDPADPFRFPVPPPKDWCEDAEGHNYGHSFGAFAMVLSAEAFKHVHGMDPKFRGWGGEDMSFLIKLDTLWGKHKNTTNQLLHVWHPKMHGKKPDRNTKIRVWQGQDDPRANEPLAGQYIKARGNPEKMWKLVDRTITFR